MKYILTITFIALILNSCGKNEGEFISKNKRELIGKNASNLSKEKPENLEEFSDEILNKKKSQYINQDAKTLTLTLIPQIEYSPQFKNTTRVASMKQIIDRGNGLPFITNINCNIKVKKFIGMTQSKGVRKITPKDIELIIDEKKVKIVAGENWSRNDNEKQEIEIKIDLPETKRDYFIEIKNKTNYRVRNNRYDLAHCRSKGLGSTSHGINNFHPDNSQSKSQAFITWNYKIVAN